jgi:hypothetical protein
MAKKAKTKTKTPKRKSKLREKVPAEYVFWCHDGSVFSDLSELEVGLMNMTDEVFAYHCNLEKQDFSNWIRDVVEDEALAEELAKATSRLQAAECVSVRLREL